MRELIRRFRGSGVAATGRRGERLAARWLRRRGYRILLRNLVLGHDEIDLVARDPDGRTIVLIEVKTRTTVTPPPEESLDERKHACLRRAAARLARRREFADAPMRLDAVAIVWPRRGRPEVRHYVSVFD